MTGNLLPYFSPRIRGQLTAYRSTDHYRRYYRRVSSLYPQLLKERDEVIIQRKIHTGNSLECGDKIVYQIKKSKKLRIIRYIIPFFSNSNSILYDLLVI